MKATYCPALSCECGYAMISEYFGVPTCPSLARYVRCTNADCKHYGKKFKVPVVDIELVELDGDSNTTRYRTR